MRAPGQRTRPATLPARRTCWGTRSAARPPERRARQPETQPENQSSPRSTQPRQSLRRQAESTCYLPPSVRNTRRRSEANRAISRRMRKDLLPLLANSLEQAQPRLSASGKLRPPNKRCPGAPSIIRSVTGDGTDGPRGTGPRSHRTRGRLTESPGFKPRDVPTKREATFGRTTPSKRARGPEPPASRHRARTRPSRQSARGRSPRPPP